jgi:hypothetical protein
MDDSLFGDESEKRSGTGTGSLRHLLVSGNPCVLALSPTSLGADAPSSAKRVDMNRLSDMVVM